MKCRPLGDDLTDWIPACAGMTGKETRHPRIRRNDGERDPSSTHSQEWRERDPSSTHSQEWRERDPSSTHAQEWRDGEETRHPRIRRNGGKETRHPRIRRNGGKETRHPRIRRNGGKEIHAFAGMAGKVKYPSSTHSPGKRPVIPAQAGIQ